MKKIEKDLKNWIAKTFGDGPYVVIGDDIMYDCVDDYIMMGKEKPEHFESYVKYANSLGLDFWVEVELPWYVICFLHELGHAMTMDSIPEHKILLDDCIKHIVETESYTQLGADLKSQVYYRLPVEKAATKWMIGFASLQTEDLQDLMEIMDSYFGEA